MPMRWSPSGAAYLRQDVRGSDDGAQGCIERGEPGSETELVPLRLKFCSGAFTRTAGLVRRFENALGRNAAGLADFSRDLHQGIVGPGRTLIRDHRAGS